MKYKCTTDYTFFLNSNYFIYDYVEDTDTLNIFIKSQRHKCSCPECGMESESLHATYERTFQDTPIHCKQTILHANIYKYNCLNPKCSCKVFMDDLPFAKASQVRTDALNMLILGVSMFLSNEGASKVLGLLGIKISNDTIQNLYNRIEVVDNPNVEEVGIDDVAIRKGQTYATAIYDLKDHHLIALLDGRDGVNLKEWLNNHKKIHVIARDRASAYASAINAILPNCIQVADRFHLLQNLLEQLKDIFKEELPKEILIRNGKILDIEPEKVMKAKKVNPSILQFLDYDNSPLVDNEGNQITFNDRKRNLNSKQYKQNSESRKKQELIRKIQQRWKNMNNVKIETICREFDICYNTAKTYLSMTDEIIKEFDMPQQRRKRKRIGDAFVNIIYKMMLDLVNTT